jgi:hypothetical protein
MRQLDIMSGPGQALFGAATQNQENTILSRRPQIPFIILNLMTAGLLCFLLILVVFWG